MVDYVIYAAYAEERDLFFLYKDLRGKGCTISRYRAKVPGEARLRTEADRNHIGLLDLYDGELAIENFE
ncbi:hypothetical protein HYU23_02315 [Candidatus Woesearchaeota archaeon]|nr:hypothetical protein [Candidatus Woesearchaeota archaeon]